MIQNWLGSGLMPYLIAYSISFVILLVGSITDLKTREVPDFVNYGLIISGVALNLLFSIVYSNFSFIINSIAGLAIFYAIAWVMFYAGQWGGGDSKMLMGLGSMIGFNVFSIKTQFLTAFLINALIVGAAYGIIWSVLLVIKNRKGFSREMKKMLSEPKIVRAKKVLLSLMVLTLAVILFAAKGYVRILLLTLLFMILVTFYLWIFVKAVEKSCMQKLVEPSKLTEGDWIVNDIYVNKKYICGPKDLGVGKKQIRQLIEFYRKGKVKKILIKEGIPFVPSFFLAFIAAFAFGNPLLLII